MIRAAIVLFGAALAIAGVAFGQWWAPFAIGLALGVAVRPRVAIPAGAVCGFLSWLVPLGGLTVRYGLGPSAVSLAEIMGFGHNGVLPVVLTLVVGTLLGLTGAWVAGTARAFARPATR